MHVAKQLAVANTKSCWKITIETIFLFFYQLVNLFFMELSVLRQYVVLKDVDVKKAPIKCFFMDRQKNVCGR